MVTLKETTRIASRCLPEEPGGDELASWRAAWPPPEPERRPRGLDTMPIDWAGVIRGAIRGERAHVLEIVGRALAGTDIIAEIEQMVDQVRTELRAEFAGQIDQLRNELFAQIDSAHTQGNELRAQLEAVIAKKKRARTKALLLPAPNGNGNAQHGPQ
jgi:hypothetical protein